MRTPCNYRSAQKAKVLEVVAHLTETLSRPICSDDLVAFYQTNPESRPLLLQRWGQILLKLARPRPSPIPYLRQIGIIGNRAYYALAATEGMRTAFEAEKRRRRAVEALSWHLADHVESMLGTEHEPQGRIAAAGFLAEFSAWDDPKLEMELSRLRRVAAGTFIPVPRTDLISRSKAVSLLHKAAERYYEDRERADHVHMNKWIGPWKWPQSHLFASVAELAYSREQIDLLALTRFGEDPIEAKCCLCFSRYALGKSEEKGLPPEP